MWKQTPRSLKLSFLLKDPCPPSFTSFKFVLLLLHLLLVLSRTQQTWDGIVLTEADSQALQSFKQELIDPRGFLRTWNTSDYGACSGGWVGIKCARGEVIVIQLPWKGLSGQISPYINQLHALRKLSLHDNLITGSIPATLGLLPKLRGLHLFNNHLSGIIPSSLGFCPLLQTLDLSNNSFVGSIPDSLANSTKLYRLNLSFNFLNGSIPVTITQSSSLVILSLRYNNLSGFIPNSWSAARKGHSVTHALEQIDLSGNELSGEIPPTIVDLPHLRSFSISYNKLSGPVPTGLARKFNSSSFVGNLQLCGYDSTAPCPIKSPSPAQAPSMVITERPNRRRLSRKDVILVAAGTLLLLLLLIICFLILYFLIRRGRKSPKANNGRTMAGETAGVSGSGRDFEKSEAESGSGETGGKLVHFEGGQMVFTADDLLCATAEIMGKSTYGTVYKATLEDGNQVAVKRLREKITKNQREFETEVNLLGKIRHPNLLALRAYYSGPKGEKLLVFDYMPKGSLAAFLHDHGAEAPMDWATRRSIVGAVARGLFHLHVNENIIHGNLTSSNVLLDDRTSARISDFGLSRLMTAAANSNVIATASALGYCAPELSKLKKANTKTDVYSLGVMMLELLTGKSPGGEAMNGVDLPHWVASVVKEEWTNEVFDVDLMREDGSAIGDELLNTLKLALHCVDPSSSARPEVQQVLHQLEAIRPEMEGGGGSSGDDGSVAPPSTSE